MTDKNKKELLTKANIIHDLKKFYLLNIRAYIIATVFVLFCTVFIMVLVFAKSDKLIIQLLPLIGVIVLDVITTALLGYEIYNYFSCSKRFVVLIDQLREKGVKRRYWYSRRSAAHFFRFAQYGYYYLAETEDKWHTTYYTWSPLGSISADSLIRSSVEGEDFYLIKVGRKIRMVYNHKLFELDKDLEIPLVDSNRKSKG